MDAPALMNSPGFRRAKIRTKEGEQRARAYLEECVGASRPVEGAEKGHERALMALWQGYGVSRYSETHCGSTSNPLIDSDFDK
jgi:hypothetical protein